MELRRMFAAPLVTVLMLASLPLVAGANGRPPAPNRLLPGQTLPRGHYLQSQNGRFRFIHQWDGNLVLYDLKQSHATGIWATHTNTGFTLTLLPASDNQADYPLGYYNQSGAIVWMPPGTRGCAHCFPRYTNKLLMQNDGNVVLYMNGPSGPPLYPLWATNTERP
jgi:hypothetical protein